jgi:hypothetical protein
MNKLFIGAAGLLFFMGCDGVTSTDTVDTGAPDSDATDTDTDTPAPTFDANDVDAAFEGAEGGIDIALTDIGSAAGFWFGMTQEGSESTDPWTGEDCLDGYTTSGGKNYNICHYFEGNSGSLSHVTDPDDVVAGDTTLLKGDLEGTLTYFLQLDTDNGGPCYTWGVDTSVYAAAPGCTTITVWGE